MLSIGISDVGSRSTIHCHICTGSNSVSNSARSERYRPTSLCVVVRGLGSLISLAVTSRKPANVKGHDRGESPDLKKFINDDDDIGS